MFELFATTLAGTTVVELFEARSTTSLELFIIIPPVAAVERFDPATEIPQNWLVTLAEVKGRFPTDKSPVPPEMPVFTISNLQVTNTLLPIFTYLPILKL